MKILFTGYASVHFVCFKPLYDELSRLPGVEIWVSDGLRGKTPDGYVYAHEAMYAPFGLSPGSVLSVEQIRDLDFDVQFSASTQRIPPRRADCRIQMFHGLSFRNRAIREENAGYDYYCVLGPYMMRGFVQRGIFQPNDPRAKKIGFPKTDPLLDGSLDRLDALGWHGLTCDRPVILYAPTGEKHNSMETAGEELIARLKKVDAYDLLIKPHDHPHKKIDWVERLQPLEDDHVRLVRTFDVIPYLSAADLLITDASSVANEYALLDRPMVFIDVPQLLKITRRKGAMLDLDTWGRKGGAVVPDAAAAVAAVADGLTNPTRESATRRAMVKDLFYNPGRATHVAMEWLGHELGLPSAGVAVA